MCPTKKRNRKANDKTTLIKQQKHIREKNVLKV